MKELLVIENENVTLKGGIASYIADLKQKIDKAKEELDGITNSLLAEMEKNNVIKLDVPELAITYIAPSERESFDSKKFREDNPDLYDEYVKFSSVKSSLRIKVK